jgi:multicomponent Na+:H+ antiporter subunit F
MITARRVRWLLGLIAIAAALAALVKLDIPVLFYQKLRYTQFFTRCFFVLLMSSVLCLYRVMRGPTAADRIVAIDILGILIVGFCAILSIPTKRAWYIDIGIAWSLQSFISTLALSKYLEGKDMDE